MSTKSVYIVSLNDDWSAVIKSILSSIFTHYRFCESQGVDALWSLQDDDVVIFDKGTLGNPSSLLISPYERGGEWLIVNGNPVDEESVAGLISLGFSGLIVSPYTLEMLPRAMRTIAAGQMWFSRDAMSQALKHLVKAGGMSCHSVNVLGARFSLSSREQQVFLLLLQGKSNKDIALQLHLSPSTVKCHVSSILLKTGKHSRNQLSTLLLEEDVDPPVKDIA
ncbi:helix-turn-helix transcriptional regulator [Enterovibrio nigricans]|nr:response regulator transcription factor [Enterovibrio nigricans]PKF49015.1 DNA-binding response regulator [Enterovibrio nigricans]